MEIIRLTADYEMKPFDCGDADLNGFLLNDAKLFAAKNLAFTFILEDEGNIVAYYSLLNDKISKRDGNNSSWRRMKKLFPHSKHFNSYPAIKIGRLAVATSYERQGIGRMLMNVIKHRLTDNTKESAFRFLTVDAYLSAVPFYERNGFKMLVADDDDKHTRLMFFDMMEL